MTAADLRVGDVVRLRMPYRGLKTIMDKTPDCVKFSRDNWFKNEYLLSLITEHWRKGQQIWPEVKG